MIELAGDSFKDYAITVSASIGDPLQIPAGTNSAPVTVTFVLRVKNPCLDPDYVEIIPSDIPLKTYALGSHGDTTPPGIRWEHAPFTVKTHPIDH